MIFKSNIISPKHQSNRLKDLKCAQILRFTIMAKAATIKQKKSIAKIRDKYYWGCRKYANLKSLFVGSKQF